MIYMEKKNVIMLTVLAIATLLTAVVGTTFAYFTATVTGNDTAKATTVSAATLGVTYTDGSQVTLSNAIPGNSATKTITVKNTSTVAVKYTIAWTSVTNTFTTSNLVYHYTKNAGTATADVAMPTAAGNFVSDVSIAAGATDTYVLTFTLKETGAEQNADQGKSFAGTFTTTVANVQQ
jgi:uncharacterized cupredoxin-like copper-binding protein